MMTVYERKYFHENVIFDDKPCTAILYPRCFLYINNIVSSHDKNFKAKECYHWHSVHMEKKVSWIFLQFSMQSFHHLYEENNVISFLWQTRLKLWLVQNWSQSSELNCETIILLWSSKKERTKYFCIILIISPKNTTFQDEHNKAFAGVQ